MCNQKPFYLKGDVLMKWLVGKRGLSQSSMIGRT